MTSTSNEYDRFRAEELIEYGVSRLTDAGLSQERSCLVAETLVEGDLMGHYTHGIRLLVPYVEQLKTGKMTAEGEPEVIRDTGSTLTWDGQYLPGPWLTHKAIGEAIDRVQEHPVVTIVIAKCHHIGCLSAYPERATEKGLMMMLSCSDPKNKNVAPFGGTKGIYSPNPIAGGIPTSRDPIIFDISTSTTAVGTVMEARDKEKELPHPWLQDTEGNTTKDPDTFFRDPPSTILPLGGQDTGYKGFALALMVEALTNGLGGHGRKEEPEKWGASVFLQIIDPDAFSGKKALEEEMTYLAEACLQSPPIDNREIRLPGGRALWLRKEQHEHGVQLEQRVVAELQEKLNGSFPAPVHD